MAYDPNSPWAQPNQQDAQGFMPDFMTPGQIKAQRDYAEALRNASMTGIEGHSGQFTAVSPLSGLVAGLRGGLGAYQMGRAGQQEQYNQNSTGYDISTLNPPGNPFAQPNPGPGASAGGVTPTAGGEIPWNSPEAVQRTIAIESGGNPNAHTGKYAGLFQLGPEEAAKYGGYGMDAGLREQAAVASQLRGILGREPTGSEVYLAHQQGLGGFQAHMANPDAPAWQNMASTAEGRQKGVGWARQAIRGNLPDNLKAYADTMTSRDFVGIWKTRFNSGHFGPQGPSNGSPAGPTPDAGTPAGPGPLAFNGNPADLGGAGGGQANPLAGPAIAASAGPVGGGVVPAPAQQTAQQLAGGPRGGSMPASGQPGLPSAGVPSPGFFPQRQQISPEQIARIVANPNMDPEVKRAMILQYQSQFQPVSAEAPYGSGQYVMAPNGEVRFVPAAPHWGEAKSGDSSVPIGAVPTQTGGVKYMGTDGQIPTPAPQGAGSNIPKRGGFNIGGGNGDVDADQAPPAAPKPHSEAEPTGANPAQVAALETGTMSDAPVPGVLGTPPPSAGPALANKPPATQTAQAPEVKTAQAEGGGNGPFDLLKRLGDYSQERKGAETLMNEDIKQYTEQKQKYNDTAKTARSAIPQIELAQKLFKDPNLIQGPWSSVKQAVNDAVTAMTGDEKATVATNLSKATEKLVASGILSTMRETLQGLGQVRVAEINLLKEASASTFNTPQANAVILYMAKRAAERQATIGKITNAYAQGTRWDEDGNMTTQNAGDRPTNTGLQSAIETYMSKHPYLSDNEITDLHNTLTADTAQKPRKQTGFTVPKGYSTSKPAQAQ